MPCSEHRTLEKAASGLAAHIDGKWDVATTDDLTPLSILFHSHTRGKIFWLREPGLLTPFKAKTFSLFLLELRLGTLSVLCSATYLSGASG